MKIVNSPLQRISSVPRVLGEATKFVDSRGRVQFGEKVVAETRLWERKTATSVVRPAMADSARSCEDCLCDLCWRRRDHSALRIRMNVKRGKLSEKKMQL